LGGSRFETVVGTPGSVHKTAVLTPQKQAVCILATWWRRPKTLAQSRVHSCGAGLPECIKIVAQLGECRSKMQTDTFVRIKTDAARHISPTDAVGRWIKNAV
jgi:hypothetical protein